MPVVVDALDLIVTAAPGTGSTSLRAWALSLPGARSVPERGSTTGSGTDDLDPKHATVADLRRAGIDPGPHLTVTSTRNPFDYHHAEWFRLRHRFAEELDDPSSWVHRVPGMVRRTQAARRLSFDDWLHQELQADQRAGVTRHLNPGHVAEADRVVRMEHLEDDLRRAGLLGATGVVEHRNASTGRPDYRSDYSPSGRSLVADVHRPDLERFGYAF